MSPPSPSPLYLDIDGTPVHAVLHRPSPDAADRGGRAAVVFCPPFGWEEVCSYRVLREWASRLAAAGHPALRLTLPSCGDSGGDPRDPGRVAAWTEAVARAARLMSAQPGGAGVVVIGLGLGGLLAYRAAAGDAPIEGLVLWATPARGRALVRQLRAFARIEEEQTSEGLPAPEPLRDGELEGGGFLLSAQTQADLEATDLSSLTLPRGLSRGALLLDRDGIAADARLRAALEAQGVAVMGGPGDGYAAMTSHPQQAEVPDRTLAGVASWLGGGPPAAGVPEAAPIATSAFAVLEHEGAELVEEPIEIPRDFGSLSGILATPHEGDSWLCVVMLNAGAIRRIGPNRMWVEAARRWAAQGIASLRLDVEGIGDADGPVTPYASDGALYVPELIPQVTAALDFLEHRGIAQRFVLAGLCGGAYWSLHAGLGDPRVGACLMLNPRALVYDSGLAPARDLRRAFTQPLTWRRLRQNVTPARILAVLRWLLGAPRRRLTGRSAGAPRSREDRTGAVVQRLIDSPHRALLLFSEGEPLEEELTSAGQLTRLEQSDGVRVERVPVRDHTLRPCFAQALTHAALDRAVEQEAELAGPARRRAAG
jgi:dienelactone hydrolase